VSESTPVLESDPAPWRERGRRWARRHPVAAALLSVYGVVTLTLIALAGVFGVFLLQDKARVEDELDEAARARAEAEQQRDAAREKAEREAQRAGAHYEKALAAVDRLASRVGKLRPADALYEERRAILDEALQFYRGLQRPEGDDPKVLREASAAYRHSARVLELLGRTDEAEKDLLQAVALTRKLGGPPGGVESQHDLAVTRNALGLLYRATGRPAEAEAALRQALELIQPLVRDHPTRDRYKLDLAAACHGLGLVYQETDRPAQAETSFRMALALHDVLAPEHIKDPDYLLPQADNYADLGGLCENTGRPAEAEELFKKELAVRERLTWNLPRAAEHQSALAGSHHRLAGVYRASNRPDAAEASALKALGLWATLARDHPHAVEYQVLLGDCLDHLVLVYAAARRLPDGVAVGDRARAVFEQLARDHPGVFYPARVARGDDHLGLLYQAAGRPEDAENAFRRAASRYQELSRAHEDVPDLVRELAGVHLNLSVLYSSIDRPEQAKESLDKALSLQEGLARDHPKAAVYRTDLALSHHKVGHLYKKKGRADQAEAAFRKAAEVLEGLTRDQPDAPQHAVLLGGIYADLGELAKDGNRPAAAEPWYGKAVAVLDPLLGQTSVEAQAREYLYQTHLGRAQLLTALGRHAEAFKDYDRSLAVYPGKDRTALVLGRAAARARLGDHARATAEAAEAAPKSAGPDTLYDLACVHSLASAAARKDAKLPPHEQERLAERYAADAVGYLRKARAVNAFARPAVAEALAKDADLDPLRLRPDFKALLAEVTTGKKPGRNGP
jgi:tetratricopeptide (TPR) repeat protein